MPTEILLFVLVASFLHAGWNFLIKKIGGGVLMVWLGAVTMTIFLLPFVIGYFWMYRPQLTDYQGLILLRSGILHFLYFIVLQKSYEAADLSVVYPVARGTGPILSSIGAAIWLGESISGVSMVGLGLVVSGIALLAGANFFKNKDKNVGRGIAWGIATGSLVAIYTLTDSQAVRAPLLLSPLLIEFSSNPIRLLILSPLAWRKRLEIKQLWQKNWPKICLFSVMAPTGFMMVLYAMRHAPVHLVAPTRELSIVIGVVLGGHFLAEKNWEWRLAGAILIFCGIGLLAFGRI
jgi:drug/metabolite transporter (DMT)-like permease